MHGPLVPSSAAGQVASTPFLYFAKCEFVNVDYRVGVYLGIPDILAHEILLLSKVNSTSAMGWIKAYNERILAGPRFVRSPEVLRSLRALQILEAPRVDRGTAGQRCDGKGQRIMTTRQLLLHLLALALLAVPVVLMTGVLVAALTGGAVDGRMLALLGTVCFHCTVAGATLFIVIGEKPKVVELPDAEEPTPDQTGIQVEAPEAARTSVKTDQRRIGKGK